jgi:hypothetical protein
MTDLEERLRRDLKELSERADPGSIRPLPMPPARKRSRAVRWLAPVAAVAAVIGVIAGVSLVDRSPGQRSASREAPGRMPPYYVIIRNGHAGLPVTVIVRASATGRVLGTLRVPFRLPGGAQDIMGTADGRTFVINDGNSLYRLRLAADGRPTPLARLRVTVPIVDDVALSPDGSTIAFDSQTCTGTQDACQYSAIRVVSLATGATRTWSTHVPVQAGSMWISWDGNDHVLFSWAGVGAPPARRSGYRLLDVSARGGNLLGARALPLPPLPVFDGYSIPQPAFVTPDGRAVITTTLSEVGSGQSPTVIMKIVERSAGTGRLLRVLHEASEHYPAPIALIPDGCWIFSLGPTGVHALVECSSPKPDFGRLDNGRFTRLPGMSVFSVPAAW